jgi:hypothetical protein
MIESLLNNEAARELFTRAVRPVLTDWGLDEVTPALVDVLLALSRHDYNLDALREMLVRIEMNMDGEE